MSTKGITKFIFLLSALCTLSLFVPYKNVLDDSLVWTSKASMPAPRADSTLVPLNGKLYYVGGSQLTDGSVIEYDPTLDVWVPRASLNLS